MMDWTDDRISIFAVKELRTARIERGQSVAYDSLRYDLDAGET
jgi:hypothetical protein